MNIKYELNMTKWEEQIINSVEKEIPISRVSTCFETKMTLLENLMLNI